VELEWRRDDAGRTWTSRLPGRERAAPEGAVPVRLRELLALLRLLEVVLGDGQVAEDAAVLRLPDLELSHHPDAAPLADLDGEAFTVLAVEPAGLRLVLLVLVVDGEGEPENLPARDCVRTRPLGRGSGRTSGRFRPSLEGRGLGAVPRLPWRPRSVSSCWLAFRGCRPTA
jgi:hypothetical protein